MLFSLYHLQNTHFVNSFSTLSESETVPWNPGLWRLLHHAATAPLAREGRNTAGLLQLWGGTRGWDSLPACCPMHLWIPPPTHSHTHPLEMFSHPLTTWADRATKNPFTFLFLGREGSSLPPGTVSGTSSRASRTSTRGGRRGTASSSLLLAVCRQIRLGRIGNLSPENQNTVTFPRTRIHLKLCSNNLDKQIYYAILCYAALTSMTL